MHPINTWLLIILRATVFDPATHKLVNADYRVSKSAWLKVCSGGCRDSKREAANTYKLSNALDDYRWHWLKYFSLSIKNNGSQKGAARNNGLETAP